MVSEDGVCDMFCANNALQCPCCHYANAKITIFFIIAYETISKLYKMVKNSGALYSLCYLCSQNYHSGVFCRIFNVREY